MFMPIFFSINLVILEILIYAIRSRFPIKIHQLQDWFDGGPSMDWRIYFKKFSKICHLFMGTCISVDLHCGRILISSKLVEKCTFNINLRWVMLVWVVSIHALSYRQMSYGRWAFDGVSSTLE